MLPLFLFCAWAIVVLLPVFEKRAKNQLGGVSIPPGFPVMPLLAWGLAARVDGFHPSLGYYFIGGLHLILVTVAAAVASKHVYQIKRRA